MLLHVQGAFSFVCATPQKVGFMSFQALSARDDVTRVFETLNSNITKANPYSTTLKGTEYTITNFTGSVYYNDVQQQDRYVDDFTANVTAGKLTLVFEFNYSHAGQQGWAFGQVAFVDFWFTKKLLIQEGFLTWELDHLTDLAVAPVTIKHSLPNLSEEAKSAYEQILNNNASEQNTLMSSLVTQINTLYKSQLSASLHSEDIININNVVYTYGGVEFKYTAAVKDFKLSNVGFKGLHYTFFFELENYTEECNVLPSTWIEEYGGVQSYHAMGWVKATAWFAASKGLFDTKLNNTWDQQMFQFYMGDIANVMPAAKQFRPSNLLTGECKFNGTQKDLMISVFSEETGTLQVEIPYKCKLYHEETLIQTLTVKTVFLYRLV